ncbi:MAG: amino acid ABC transporter permease [Anaerolineae bacterium]|nr:amino acid ABC transporter permease [Anaerolineae bacterium]
MSDQPIQPRRAATESIYRLLNRIPWWGVIVAIVGIVIGFGVLSNVKYLDAIYFLFDLPWDRELLAEIQVEGETWSFTPDVKVPLKPGTYTIFAEYNRATARAREEIVLLAEPHADAAPGDTLVKDEPVSLVKWHLIPKQDLTLPQNWAYVQSEDGRAGWTLDRNLSKPDLKPAGKSDRYRIEVPEGATPGDATPIAAPPEQMMTVQTSTPTLQGLVETGAYVRIYDRYDLGETLRRIWRAGGVMMTLRATVFGFGLALILGLIAGLMLVSNNVILLAISKLYVEVIRGIPLLVIILYAGFVLAPWLRDATGGKIDLGGFPGAVIGLGFGYGAYLAEVFRAGIESIHYGQMEAARSLGMTYFQAMRHIVLPQAIRVVLPPLGNDFIAMLKDSSLISVVALPEILQQGRLWVSRTFRAFEGYNTVALFYLVMTLLLSLLVRMIERKTKLPGRSEE